MYLLLLFLGGDVHPEPPPHLVEEGGRPYPAPFRS